MDHQFKKIIQKTKAWNKGSDPLSKTFEGALYKESAWPFFFSEPLEVQQSFPNENSTTDILEATTELPQNRYHSLVLFIGDSYIAEKGGEDLLGKMINAMKLTAGEFNRFLFDERLEDVFDLKSNLENPSGATLRLYEAIIKYKPKFVVSLGATVTNILLGRREKLSGIHGQFFDKSLEIPEGIHQFTVMPIFHPDFLVINPNMKRTAWIDLQKVMESIGKI